MRLARKIACGALATLLVLVALLVANTLRLPRPAPPAAPTQPAPIAIDAAVARLAQALRLRTVSYDDPARDDPAQLAALQELLARSFPRVHQNLHHEVVGEHTLLFSWPGRHPELPPVLLMAHQ